MTRVVKASMILAAAMVAGGVSVHCQTTLAAKLDVAPAFDVISVRPSASAEFARVGFTADGVTAANASLQMIITFAYDVTRDPSLTIGRQLIPGGPGWILKDGYDIQAKMSDADLTALQKLDRRQQTAQKRLMLQALLRDRFQLKMHFAAKEVPGYSLVVMKGGPKNLTKEPDDAKAGFDRSQDHLTFRASPMGDFTVMLTQEMRRPVVDATGLTGKYDFSLGWSLGPDGNPVRGGPARETGDPAQAAPAGLTMVTAVQEQLGMKLVPTKTVYDAPVIDSVERPSPN